MNSNIDVDDESKIQGESNLDLFVFFGAVMLLLFAAMYALYEGTKIDIDKRDADARSGALQKRILYFGLCGAATYKAIAMSLEYILFSEQNCTTLVFCTFLKLSPDLIFLTIFSTLVWYWTQLSNDVAGRLSTINFPATIFCNLFGYGIFGITLVIKYKSIGDIYLYIIMTLLNVILLIFMISCTIIISNHISSTTTIGQKIITRLVLLSSICSYVTVFGMILYGNCFLETWKHHTIRDYNSFYLYEGVIAILKDIIPCILIIVVLRKRPNTSQNLLSSSSTGRGHNGYLSIIDNKNTLQNYSQYNTVLRNEYNPVGDDFM